MGYTGVYWLCWVTLGYAGAVLGYTGLDWVLPVSTGPYWAVSVGGPHPRFRCRCPPPVGTGPGPVRGGGETGGGRGGDPEALKRPRRGRGGAAPAGASIRSFGPPPNAWDPPPGYLGPPPDTWDPPSTSGTPPRISGAPPPEGDGLIRRKLQDGGGGGGGGFWGVPGGPGGPDPGPGPLRHLGWGLLRSAGRRLRRLRAHPAGPRTWLFLGGSLGLCEAVGLDPSLGVVGAIAGGLPQSPLLPGGSRGALALLLFTSGLWLLLGLILRLGLRLLLGGTGGALGGPGPPRASGWRWCGCLRGAGRGCTASRGCCPPCPCPPCTTPSTGPWPRCRRWGRGGAGSGCPPSPAASWGAPDPDSSGGCACGPGPSPAT
ncbi:uncharacterized protein ACIBXB_005447 [Morphnus guianensis]